MAEAKSLTKAAEALLVLLPAASTRIKNLGQSIGAKPLKLRIQVSRFGSACRMIEAGLDEMPNFARDLIDLLSEDSRWAGA